MSPLKTLYSVFVVPLIIVTLLTSPYLFYQAWEFMTLPTARKIERRIQADLPGGADKTKALAFLDEFKFRHESYKKVTNSWKTTSDYQEKNVKGQINLIEYDVGGYTQTASWEIWKTSAEVRFYFDKDGKLITYTLREVKESP